MTMTKQENNINTIIYAFIDTCIFIDQNYNYESKLFQTLLERISNNQIKLFLTDITIKEIESNINEDVHEASNAINRSRKKAKILKNLPQENIITIFEDIDHKNLTSELKKQLKYFIEKSHSEILTSSHIQPDLIFDIYFNKKPPFGSGKKKCEFPDAFILAILENHAQEKDIKIHIISTDTDMEKIQETFPNLVVRKLFAEFLSEVAFLFDELAPIATQIFHENIDEIKLSFKNNFEVMGFILEDQDGDVNDVAVINVDEIDSYLMDMKKVGDNRYSAYFELVVEVEFNADISYDDLETAMYDHEDKILIPWQTIDETVKRTEKITTEVAFLFSKDEPYSFSLTGTEISSHTDVYIEAIEWDGYK